MIRSTTFDDKYMLVDKQGYIVCTAYGLDLEKIANFLHNKNSSNYTMIVRHFDIDKCDMTVKEYDSQGNILDEGFLSYYEYGNAIWK